MSQNDYLEAKHPQLQKRFEFDIVMNILRDLRDILSLSNGFEGEMNECT